MNLLKTKTIRQKLKPMLPYLSLPLILLVTLFLWLNLPEEQFSSVYSSNSTWDLRRFNFYNAFASLHGRVETIALPFLNPQEFAERENEIALEYPGIGNNNATVRVRMLLPYDEYYLITRINTGHADRIYVNGERLREIGNPMWQEGHASAFESDDNILFSPTITFTARPIDGVIEIVHRQSNFIFHVHGIYNGRLLDEYAYGNAIERVEYTTNIVLGILLALAIVSLLLFLLLHNYRPALMFSVLCFAWLVYTGAMGSKVFVSILPRLTDPLRLRFTFMITPLTAVFMAAIVYDMFPGILNRYFVRAAVVIFSAWTVMFAFLDISFILGYALWICMGMAGIGVSYAVIVLIKNLRKPDVLRSIFIIGVIIIGYAALRDIFVYLSLNVEHFSFLIPPFDGTNFARVGVIAFLFCMAASIFIATLREMEAVKTNELKSETARQQLSAENAALESLHKMKPKFPQSLN